VEQQAMCWYMLVLEDDWCIHVDQQAWPTGCCTADSCLPQLYYDDEDDDCLME
jgi:hypothetical protein